VVRKSRGYSISQISTDYTWACCTVHVPLNSSLMSKKII
jgi:hypothetical protein